MRDSTEVTGRSRFLALVDVVFLFQAAKTQLRLPYETQSGARVNLPKLPAGRKRVAVRGFFVRKAPLTAGRILTALPRQGSFLAYIDRINHSSVRARLIIGG